MYANSITSWLLVALSTTIPTSALPIRDCANCRRSVVPTDLDLPMPRHYRRQFGMASPFGDPTGGMSPFPDPNGGMSPFSGASGMSPFAGAPSMPPFSGASGMSPFAGAPSMMGSGAPQTGMMGSPGMMGAGSMNQGLGNPFRQPSSVSPFANPMSAGPTPAGSTRLTTGSTFPGSSAGFGSPFPPSPFGMPPQSIPSTGLPLTPQDQALAGSLGSPLTMATSAGTAPMLQNTGLPQSTSRIVSLPSVPNSAVSAAAISSSNDPTGFSSSSGASAGSSIGSSALPVFPSMK